MAAEPAALRARIITATGSESDADSVLRSLERLGSDPSIERYEMTQVIGRRAHGGASSSSWRLHAERAELAPPGGDGP
jgi:hypothetical protein